MALNNYNNILTSGRCPKKDPKYTQIMDVVGVAQNFADNSKKSNRYPSNGDPAYIRELPHWVPEEPKVGVRNKTKDRKEYCL